MKKDGKPFKNWVSNNSDKKPVGEPSLIDNILKPFFKVKHVESSTSERTLA